MSDNEQAVIFRTGTLWEFDAVTSALRDAGIPHFTREEVSSGLNFAMPAAPSGYPGTWWAVRVPTAAVEDAKRILHKFPFAEKTNPSVFDFTPSKTTWPGWKIYGIAMLVCIIGALILAIIRALLE